jgi:hypothetical protein
MSYSYTYSETFTITHARELASRVAADLHLCTAFYNGPNEAKVRDYAEELAQLLRGGYVSKYEFGFEKNGARVVCWHYLVDERGAITSNDEPGRVISRVDVAGCSFYNYLWYSSAWSSLSSTERQRIREGLPISRGTGDPPCDGLGYWESDRNYHAGGRSLSRKTFRPYA